MRKVNIQSRKQPWVSHSHWDSEAFNRNTHSLFLINRAGASMCADLNSVFSIPGKPARHPSHTLQTGWAVGLGSFYLVLAIGWHLCFVRNCFSLSLLCTTLCVRSSVCAALTELSWAGYLGNNRNVFVSVLEAGKSKTELSASVMTGEEWLPGSQMAPVCSCGRRWRTLVSLVPYKGPNPITRHSPDLTS